MNKAVTLSLCNLDDKSIERLTVYMKECWNAGETDVMENGAHYHDP